jgi:hypothetical protein
MIASTSSSFMIRYSSSSDRHLGARVLAEEDAVVGLHVQRDLLAVLHHLPGAHRDDPALLGLLLRGVGNDDAALLGVLLFLALDEDPGS